MFPLVKLTPTKKLVHTAAFEMRLEYRPHRKGPRKAPASAPQLMDISCAMNVIDELYCTSAMIAEMATNATSRPRIHVS